MPVNSCRIQAPGLYCIRSKYKFMIHFNRYFHPGPKDGTGAPIKNNELNEEDDFNDDEAIVNSEETADIDEDNADTDTGFEEAEESEEDILEDSGSMEHEEEQDDESNKI